MKKTFLLFAIAACLPFIMHAQRVEVAPFGGYVFAGTMQTGNGNVRFMDNAQYGGIISIAMSRSLDFDLLYNRSDTKAQINYNTPVSNLFYTQVPLSINYMHIGFTKNFRVNPHASPFIGFNLGTCLFAPKESYADAWFFSLGINAGAKVYFGKRLGIRIQAQGMMPVQSSGFSFFVGSGGSGGGLSLYSTLFQFGFTGGLIFRLGHIQ
jgi:hypothetical protein